MREVVKFNGQPVEVQLTYATGKESDNGKGAFYTYSLVGEKIIFAPPELNEAIQAQRPRKGERLSIQLLANKRWDVKRITEEQGLETLAPPFSATNNNGNRNTRRDTMTALGDVLVNGISEPRPAAPSLMTGQSQFILQQLTAAVEAVAAVENYAKLMNRPVTFSSEDIRAIAISCFISQSRQTAREATNAHHV